MSFVWKESWELLHVMHRTFLLLNSIHYQPTLGTVPTIESMDTPVYL